MSNGLAWKLKEYHSNILNEIDLLVHVPKYDENHKNSFNHSLYSAKCLSTELDKNFDQNLVIHKVPYQPIFEISKKTDDLKGSVVMIVDDVYTKGLNKGPIARKLIEKGAFAVYIGVFGRTKYSNVIKYDDMTKINLDASCPYYGDTNIEDMRLHFQLCNKAPNQIQLEHFYELGLEK